MNFEDEVAFLAVSGERESEAIVGSSCYYVDHTTNFAEAGFMVADALQGTGLGQALQQRMREHALRCGVRGFTYEILGSNASMIALAQKGGEQVRIAWNEEVCEVTACFVSAPKDHDVP